MKAKILWIEGKRAGSPPFIPGVRRKGYSVEVVSSGQEAVARLAEVDPDLVVLYAFSMRSTGKRICRSISQVKPNLPIVVIADPEHMLNGEVCATEILVLPFTTRKLLNRISSLVPVKGAQTLEIGPICLDLDRRQVRCLERETRLTPRLTHLLQILMEHPGEVLERGSLFSEVWKTEYTGDTRTLDVHISWLRQAIEPDPRRPQFLKTIRGLGYRLDV